MNRTQWLTILGVLAIIAGIVLIVFGNVLSDDTAPDTTSNPVSPETTNSDSPSEEHLEQQGEYSPANPTAETVQEQESSGAVRNRALGRGRIHGTVRMSDGSPLPPDIEVGLRAYKDTDEVADPVTAEIDTTGLAPDGTYEFTRLPFGNYVIYAGNAEYTQHSSAAITSERLDWERTLTLYPGGTITGRVIDESGQPIPEARVYVAAYDIAGSQTNANRTRALGSQVQTDDNGAFTMRHLRSSAPADQGYKLAASAEGYAMFTSEYIHAGTEGHEFVLTAGGTAQGQLVMQDTREPVPGKSLRFTSGLSVGDRVVQTDTEGWFFAFGLSPGEYNITLVDEEMVLTSETNKISVVPNREVSDLLLLAAQGGIISGHVRDEETGNGIADVEMGISGAGDKSVRTDATGAYRVTGLVGGQYRVRVSEVDGYPEYSNRNPRDRTVTVAAATEIADIDFQLYRGIRVSGIVVDESGKPVPEARINAYTYRSNSHAQDSATSDAAGRFTLAGYPPNTSLRLSANKGELTESPESTTVNIGETDLTGVRVEMIVGASVSGRVFDRQGNPVGSMQMYARPDHNMGGSTIEQTAADGSFNITGLPPGKYDLTPWQSGSQDQKPMQTVTLAKGQKLEGLRLVHEVTGMAISGIVTDAEGQPINNATIRQMGPGWSQTDTDGDGRFTMSGLTEGAYQLQAYHYNYSPSDSRSVNAGDRNVRFILDGKATIEGRIVSASNGQPVTTFEIAHEAVGAQDIFVSNEFRHVTHPQGQFTLTNVNKGTRKIMVRADGYTMGVENVANLKPGETRQNVVLRLDAGAKVAGRVTDDRGNPISGARIFVGQLPYQWERDRNVRATSGAGGAFELSDLSAGAHEIWAIHDKFAPGSANITAAVGISASATIVLNQGGTIRGRVTMAGRPVQDAFINAIRASDGRDQNTAQTNNNGEFSVSGIADGNYQVNVNTNQRSRSVPAQVASGMTTEVNVDFPNATGRIYGLITNADGEPISGVNYLQAMVSMSDGTTENQGAQPASDGTYEFNNMPAGTIVITIHYAGAQRRSEVELRDGQTLEHNIVIDEGSKIQLTVNGVDPAAHMASVTAVIGDVDLSALAADPMTYFQALQPNVASAGMLQNGQATLAGLEPGDYTILVMRFDATAANSGDPDTMIATMRFVSGKATVAQDATTPLTLSF